MAKTRLRGKGGRPRQEGERFPNGRLKPPGPNQIVIDRRKAICEDVTMATCPLDAAYARGWLTQAEYGAGKAYVAIHSGAGFQGPGSSSSRDTSLPKGSVDQLRAHWQTMTRGEVLAFNLLSLTQKELVAIWDSALRDLGRSADPETAEQFAADATRKWRAVNTQLTSHERNAIDAFCVREVWPQWLTERLAGNDSGRWADQRNILVEGLRIVGRSLRQPKTPAVVDIVQTPRPRATGQLRVERTVYVDEAGAKVLEVERRTRRPD